MTDHVTIIRYNDKLRMVLEKLKELKERWQRIGLPDQSRFGNSSAIFTFNLKNMIILAEVITLGALLRDESRGAHYKPEFPGRNDEKYLKTTLAQYAPDGPRINYEPVDTSYIPPRPRTYEVAG
jgi:succinate dehydrogenase / fumarate reductase flavoprotein subunit